MAVGIRVIYEPLGLVTGGVSGFAIVVEFMDFGCFFRVEFLYGFLQQL